MEPDETHEAPQKQPGRLSSAWAVLRGQAIVPNAIRAEWAAWQIEFVNVLDKVTSASARAYERDKVKLRAAEKRVAELEAGVPEQTEAAPLTGGGWNPDKLELNRRALVLRGISMPSFQTNGESDVPGHQAE